MYKRQDKQREIQSKIITLKSKADALADTLDSRNASGSLERDTDVASLGRLTDFIHVACLLYTSALWHRPGNPQRNMPISTNSMNANARWSAD